MPTIGRGGAGNIHSTSSLSPLAQKNAAISSDLEANQQDAENYTDSSHDLEQKEQRQYAHMGRGGAGNYYSPKELSQKGHFAGADTSHVPGDGTPAPNPQADASVAFGSTLQKIPSSSSGLEQRRGSTGAWRGRGGAGNYAYGVSEAEERAARKRIENEAEKDKLRGMIERSVEEGLPMPEKAKLPGAEPC